MELNQGLVQSVVATAKSAGEAILDIYNAEKNYEIKMKADNSPVTAADFVAHQIITRQLTALTADIPVLSEEDQTITYEMRKNWQRYWLVDPLDGTQEFIRRSGQFTVNIALIENSKSILGVIYVPLKNEFYYAARGVGAYKQAEGVYRLNVRDWQPEQEIILVATRRELHEDLQAKLSDFAKLKITYRSSSLKFCLLAEGRADIYLRKTPIHEWDTAAGQCILEEAGGIVLDSNWQPLRYNTKSDLLNPPFIALGDSKQLLSILKMMPMF